MKNKTLFKKAIPAFLLWLLLVLPAGAQLGVDLSVGSQSARIRNIEQFKQYFSLSPSVRYQTPVVFFKMGYRFGFSGTTTLKGREVELDPNYNEYISTGKTAQINTRFAERGFGIGIGFTFGGSESMTRPYLMFEYYSMKTNFTFENPSTLVMLDEEIGNNNPYSRNEKPINGRKLEHSTPQFRFGAGFQFGLGGNLALLYEASINLNNAYGFYAVNFSIDLGLRYFFRQLEK